MDEYTVQFGERVRQRRKALGLTQLDLALRMGFKSKQAISHIEAGDRNLKQSQVTAIASALNTTPAYLMGWEDKPISDENKLFSLYNQMDAADRAELIKYAEYKLTDEKYKKESKELA